MLHRQVLGSDTHDFRSNAPNCRAIFGSQEFCLTDPQSHLLTGGLPRAPLQLQRQSRVTKTEIFTAWPLWHVTCLPCNGSTMWPGTLNVVLECPTSQGSTTKERLSLSRADSLPGNTSRVPLPWLVVSTAGSLADSFLWHSHRAAFAESHRLLLLLFWKHTRLFVVLPHWLELAMRCGKVRWTVQI